MRPDPSLDRRNLIGVAHAAYLTKYGSYYGKVKRPALA
jgi:hypothetical protein